MSSFFATIRQSRSKIDFSTPKIAKMAKSIMKKIFFEFSVPGVISRPKTCRKHKKSRGQVLWDFAIFGRWTTSKSVIRSTLRDYNSLRSLTKCVLYKLDIVKVVVINIEY